MSAKPARVMPPFEVEQRNLPAFRLEARVASFDDERGTFDIVWSRGATVLIPRFFGDDILEELPLTGDDVRVRMDAFQAGRAPYLEDHRQSVSSVIGVIERAAIEMVDGAPAGTATVRLADTPGTAETRAKIAQGILRNVSVGFRVHEARETTTDEDKLAGVRRFRAIDWEPREASQVAIGADAGAHVRSDGGEDGPDSALYPCTVHVRTQEAETMPPEDLTQQGEQEPTTPNGSTSGERSEPNTNTPSPAAAAAAPAAQPAAQAPNLDSVRAEAATAERTRIREVTQLAGRAGLDEANPLVQRAFDEGWDSGRAAQAFLNQQADAETPSDTAVTSGQRELSAEGFEAAASMGLAARADQARSFSHGRAESFEAPLDDDANARSRTFARRSLVGICEDLLESRGVRTRGMATIDMVDAALRIPSYTGGERSAPQTTSALSAIVLDAQNKFLRRAFGEAQRTWAPITRLRTASDFKTLNTVGLSAAPDLVAVDADGGPVEHGQMADVNQGYAIEEFARIVSLSRKMIVNDDMDALSRIPAAMGQAAERLAADLLWAQLTSNPSMAEDSANLFSAGHSNDGTEALVDETDLSQARAKMRVQRGLDKVDADGLVLEQGPLLNLVPRYLIVPSALETTADKVTATITPANTDDANPFAANGRTSLTPIVEPRLDAASLTTWYTACGTDQIDILELATLDGMSTPRFMVAESIDYLGVKTRVEWPVGARVIDYRGLTRDVG